ncbi:MAG TPA: phage/plasmid primase, P4 family [Candidatus Binataceae bacterium]|nr:phage/plasmid primase, P4 family [Candidatus Binataceae bacterium]
MGTVSNHERAFSQADPAEILRALELFCPDDGVIEIRGLHGPYNQTYSGYFDYKHLPEAARLAAGIKASGVYVTLNPCSTALLARAANRIVEKPQSTTADPDIVRRRWLPIDLDPRRAAGISSSDSEKAAAMARAEEIREYLAGLSWVEPIVGDSGNGGHLLYPIDLPNDDASRKLIERGLKALALRFSDEKVDLDIKVGNASRIWKLYGTVARKGDSTEERPHRLSRILYDPQLRPGEIATPEQLAVLAATLPEEPKPEHRNGNGKQADFDLGAWIRDHAVPVHGPTPWSGGEKWLFDRGTGCPFGGGHDQEGSFIARLSSGAISAGCQHNSCAGKKWSDLRKIYQPDYDPGRNGHHTTNGATVDLKVAAADSPADDLRPPEFSDDSIALTFANSHEDDLRHFAEWNRWLGWDSARWREDRTLKAFDQVRRTCRVAAALAIESLKNGGQVASKITSAKTVAAVHTLARADRRLAATVDQWDVDPYLLNTPGGTIDLRTGELRAHCPTDYLTQVTAAAPADSEECPLWLSALERIFDHDVDLIRFIQRALGHTASGSVAEECLFFLIGTGSNGKDTLAETARVALGDYGGIAAPGLLLEQQFQAHPTEIADLRGIRMALTSEIDAGQAWAEAKLKRLTGGVTKLKGRFMRGDFFNFTPTHKLWIMANTRPRLHNVDPAIKRRLFMIPFNVEFKGTGRDLKLKEKLQSELPGILRWIINGAVAWHQEGVNPPDSVIDTTADYFNDADQFQHWIDECCERDPNAKSSTRPLWRSWKAWAGANKEYIGTETEFIDRLKGHGFKHVKKNWGRGFEGIILKDPVDPACGEAWTRE